MSLEDQHALDLLKAAYRAAEWQERGGGWLLLTFLDTAAEHVGLNPTERHIPEGRAYRRAVGFLLSSGAVEIPAIRDHQDIAASTTLYEITPQGIGMLRWAGRIP